MPAAEIAGAAITSNRFCAERPRQGANARNAKFVSCVGGSRQRGVTVTLVSARETHEERLLRQTRKARAESSDAARPA